MRIFCPFWIINKSQYILWFKQERKSELPAGDGQARRIGLSHRDTQGALELNDVVPPPTPARHRLIEQQEGPRM
jgi:hypothetical protein